MNNIPDNLKYAKTHEWVKIDPATGIATIGITDHAQHLLGDLVFVELPDVGQMLDAGEECAVVESVKAASDVYSPITGEVLEVNPALIDTPELVNSSPYEDGWLFTLKPAGKNNGLDNLLTDADYAASIADEE